MTRPVGRLRRAAVYAGGFMGPFAGGMAAAILTELGGSFGISAAAAAACIPAYLVPFASIMLVSGSIAESVGRARVLRIAYASYVAAALMCALAPTWGVFIAGCVLAGSSNAFTTPILLATLGRSAAKARLGRALGLYSAAQSLGQLSAPGFGGLVAVLDWRFAYGAVALVALVLFVIGVPADAGSGRLRLRSLVDGITLPVLRIGGAQFAIGFGALGMAFLIALQAGTEFGSGPAERGLIVMCGGLAAFVTSPLAGRAVDRWGTKRVMLTGLAMTAAAIALPPLTHAPWAIALVWSLAFASAQLVTVSSNGAVLALPNGGAGVSVTQAFRFFGSAVAPAVVLPIYIAQPGWGFWVPAIALIAAMSLLAISSGRRPRQG